VKFKWKTLKTTLEKETFNGTNNKKKKKWDQDVENKRDMSLWERPLGRVLMEIRLRIYDIPPLP
jgi:hypothetical protein